MIEIIEKEKIDQALSKNHRQYLVGNLQFPQELLHIQDNNIEIGITRFSEYAFEKPHYHPDVTEYQLLLSGSAKYVDVEANKEYFIQEGDVFVIRPGTTYIQKSPQNTTILFFKHPGINDKIIVPLTEKMLHWAQSWEQGW